MNDEARPNLEPIEKMVDELGVDTVFGEPIREGDVTVVPVAEVRFAFGPTATVRGGAGASRRKAALGQRKAAGVAVAQAAGPLPKATFASLPMRSGSSQCWTSRASRWPASPSRRGASSGSAGQFVLLAGDAEGTYRAL
jgi:hypothetical protein